MFWYIVLCIMIILLIISIIKEVQDTDSLWWVAIIFCSAAIILTAMSILVIKVQYKKDIAAFIETKRYIEEVAPTLSQTDNYSITNARIGMNQWLYRIQFRYKNYHFWNFIPKEVIELEEIK